MQICPLAKVSYQEARVIQEERINNLYSGKEDEAIFLFEHQPVLTLGYRKDCADLGISKEEWQKLGVEIIQTSRGGAATYHGPGQIVAYPVISLKKRNWGVKKYISKGLEAIVETLAVYDLASRVDLEVAGVWTLKTNKKIAQVGLRIVNGLTNHGFSLNIACNLEIFKYFKPCNLSADLVTDLKQELESFNVDVYEVGKVLAEKMHYKFTNY